MRIESYEFKVEFAERPRTGKHRLQIHIYLFSNEQSLSNNNQSEHLLDCNPNVNCVKDKIFSKIFEDYTV